MKILSWKANNETVYRIEKNMYVSKSLGTRIEIEKKKKEKKTKESIADSVDRNFLRNISCFKSYKSS